MATATIHPKQAALAAALLPIAAVRPFLLDLLQRVERGSAATAAELEYHQRTAEYGHFWAEAAAVAALQLGEYEWWGWAAESAARALALHSEEILLGGAEDPQLYKILHARALRRIRSKLAECR